MAGTRGKLVHWWVAAVCALATAVSLGAAAATRTTTNGILTLLIEDSGSSAGQWWARTGASHPTASAGVIYDTTTSWITLRDATANVMFPNDSVGTAGLAGYTVQNMNDATTAVVSNLASGFRTTWTMTNWTVVQDVEINGTTLADTNIRHRVTVTNTTGASRQYGLRYMWDWEINDQDDSIFRQRNPDTAFTDVFQTFNNPAFQFYEMGTTPASFSVFGTIAGGSLSPAPTPPDQFRYSAWSPANGSAWDFTNSGSGVDSATEYYWGFSTPLTLAPSATATFIQYLSTVQSAVGGGTPPPTSPTEIPTLSEWAMIALSMLVGLAALGSMRRRKY